jgi:hypothetical protein
MFSSVVVELSMMVVQDKIAGQTILTVSRRFKLSSSPPTPPTQHPRINSFDTSIMLTLTLTADLTGLVMCVRWLTLS